MRERERDRRRERDGARGKIIVSEGARGIEMADSRASERERSETLVHLSHCTMAAVSFHFNLYDLHRGIHLVRTGRR
ncbi:Hypothetical protein NTJ_11737 [Nesidiocoris tenuis]|uniref:Uncharacterized protein n=1 Tax=Nesidiocoris tenuis TaxID=355587 RepID=A0ABN7B3E4_9HEMI|nr:Hypothetical protein NTJ_11737 [Nesidiocoris tenuis]